MTPRFPFTLPSLAVSALFLASACASVGPGRVGVLWRASGGTQPDIYGEGLHAVAPWNELSLYDLRVMTHDEPLDVIAINGLAIKLDAAVRYRLVPGEVIGLQEEVGPEYYEKILEPVLRSEARRVIGRYTPEEIYSTRRDVIEKETREGVRAKIAGKHIELEAILIRNVELPETIRRAIDQKLAAEQEVLKMQYVLEVAKASAEQKQIEAGAISEYNKTVGASLTPAVLDFERIEQLTKLAQSPNAKTVFMGANVGAPGVLVSVPPGGRSPTASR
jgi:prohibitin 2